jgi:type I restriction enzyme M protein
MWTSIAHTRAFLFTRAALADLVAAAAGHRTAVLSYDETEHTRERVDIAKLNAELATTVATIDQLRTEIDAIVAEINCREVEA